MGRKYLDVPCGSLRSLSELKIRKSFGLLGYQIYQDARVGRRLWIIGKGQIRGLG